MGPGSVVLAASGAPSTGLANALVTGIVTGSVVALGAIGLSLVYSIAEVPNFAHGELLTLGAYLAFFVNKPSVVPVYDLFSTGEQSVSTFGLVVLFLLTVASFLLIVKHLGSEEWLSGAWWSYDVDPVVGYAVHIGVAVLMGALVVLATPSLLGGMLFAALSLGAIAPMFDRTVFAKFRERGDDLATLLIVALGLSFVLRYGIQAFFGGNVRSFAVPDVATVAGMGVPLSAAQDFDLFWTGSELIVRVVNTRPDPSVTTAVVQYPLLSLLAVVVLPLVVAVGLHRWREGSGEGFTSGQTVGPRLTAAIGWVLSTAVLLFALAGDGTVPSSYAWATKVTISVLRISPLLIAVVMIGFLHFLLKETKMGIAMRASSDNLDLAKVTGINTQRVMMTSWIIAGMYSAVAGIMAGALFFTVTPNLGFFRLLPIFAGVILGGVTSVYGAVLGSYVVGFSMELGIFALNLSGVHRVSMAFLVLIVVLLVKPEGLIGGGN